MSRYLLPILGSVPPLLYLLWGPFWGLVTKPSLYGSALFAFAGAVTWIMSRFDDGFRRRLEVSRDKGGRNIKRVCVCVCVPGNAVKPVDISRVAVCAHYRRTIPVLVYLLNCPWRVL